MPPSKCPSQWYRNKLPWADVIKHAVNECVPAHLFAAMILQESSGIETAVREEPHWKYYFQVEKFAKKLKIPLKAEEFGQRQSYGLCQVMGSVFRELGYSGPWEGCYDRNTNLKYGAKKLRQCLDRFPFWWDAVAAYNGGPGAVFYKRKHGKFKDDVQLHVDRVRGYLNCLIPNPDASKPVE